MLPQFGLAEFLLIAVAALIVVGPSDLPLMMRKIGRFVAQGKAMAREFQSAFDDMARQAELDELRKEIEQIKRDNAVSQAVDDLRAVESDMNEAVMRGAGDGPADTGSENVGATDRDATPKPEGGTA